MALLQLRHNPGVELVTLHQLRPAVRSIRLDRFPHQSSRAVSFSPLCTEALRVALLGHVNLHDLLLETACIQTSRQLASRSPPFDWKLPLLVPCSWLLPFALPRIFFMTDEIELTRK